MFWLSPNAITLFNILIQTSSYSISCYFKVSLAPRFWILATLAFPELGMKWSRIPFIPPSDLPPLLLSVVTPTFVSCMDHWRQCPFPPVESVPSEEPNAAQLRCASGTTHRAGLPALVEWLCCLWWCCSYRAPGRVPDADIALSCDPHYKLRR